MISKIASQEQPLLRSSRVHSTRSVTPQRSRRDQIEYNQYGTPKIEYQVSTQPNY